MIGVFVSATKDLYSRVLRISKEYDGFIYKLANMFILSKLPRSHGLGLLALQKTETDFESDPS